MMMTESGNHVDEFESYTNKVKSDISQKKIKTKTIYTPSLQNIIFFEIFHKFVIDFKNNQENCFILNHDSSNELLLNVVSINVNSLKTVPKSVDVLEYLKYLKLTMNNIKI